MTIAHRPEPATSRSIAVVVPTRDRGNMIVATLQSLLIDPDDRSPVLVIDQSVDDRTQFAVDELPANSRLAYHRSAGQGLSAAFNEGIARSTADWIFLTGDDCLAPPGLSAEIASLVSAHPQADIIFGSVLPDRYPPAGNFSPGFIVKRTVTITGILAKHRIGGTSACMLLRRAAWLDRRGFDELMGVGAPFQSAEDTDLCVRVLLADGRVVETEHLHVIHMNDMAINRRKALIRRNWSGTGAAFGKAIRLAPWRASLSIGRMGLQRISGRARNAHGLEAANHQWTMLRAFVHGLRLGLAQPLDKTSGHFVPSAAQSASGVGARADDLARNE